MIFVLYALVAAGVVFLSVKASNYVDMLDKTTNLSGAFIGGIMLSAVTSLPELFTSISATVLLDKPGLCIGNILGSDLFNLAALSAVALIFFKVFRDAKVSGSHLKVSIVVIAIYAVLSLNMLGILTISFFSVSLTSLIIIALYILGVKMMANDDGGDRDLPEDNMEINLTTNQIVFRFIAVSIGIVVLAIFMTYITDEISAVLGIGSGLAGALFLGIATSLPELSSTIQLFRIRNVDIAVGNIVGSNLFNFIILSLADIFYVGSGVYDFSDPQTYNLLVFGFISAVSMAGLLVGKKSKALNIICPIIMLACYAAFLVV